MIFTELQRSLLGTAIWDVNAGAFASWTAVMGVCFSWREVALSYPELWETVVSIPNKVYGIPVADDAGTLVATWPDPTRPMRLLLSPDGANEALMKAMEPEVSRICEMRFLVDDEQSRSEITRLTRTAGHLRTLVITEDDEDAFMMPKVYGAFAFLEVLCLSGYSLLHQMSAINLRTLKIANACFCLREELESLMYFIEATPRLNDAALHDVTFTIPEEDIPTGGHLMRPNLREITCANTSGVVTFFKCFGIPPSATLVMRDVSGNILPDEASLLGDFIDKAAADVYIGRGYLKIVISQSGSVLKAEWTRRFDASLRTFAGLLKHVYALRVHKVEGGVGGRGNNGELGSAEQIQTHVLQLAGQMRIDCEVVEG